MKCLKHVPQQFVLILIGSLILSPVIAAPKPPKKNIKTSEERVLAVVWRDPGDVSTLNLFYGAGGKEHAPDPDGKFTFVKEDMNGTSPKFDVKDENGVEWRVKLGQEPQSETAATRLLWAAGYFVDEDYYLTELKVQDLPKLRRGRSFVSKQGMVYRARLERRIKNVKKLGNWDWFHNQCGTATEMNGLRIMMSFINNWDLKSTNNEVEDVGGERRCVVTDLGATLGGTGNVFERSKGVETDYVRSPFISKVRPDYVNFTLHSRPFLLTVFNLPNYLARTRMEKITKNIPRADARWLGQRLALLSTEQIHDCFSAAGYTQKEIDGYTMVVQRRIAQLKAL